MSFIEIVLPILGLSLVINSASSLYRTGLEKKDVVELIIGVLICVFSIWSASSNSTATVKLQASVDSSQSKINMMLSQRQIDSTNNANFQKYLRDSFGIQVIDIATNSVKRTNNFYTIVSPEKTGISPSENFGYKFSSNRDTLIVFPKSGVWVKPFFSFDASLEKNNSAIFLPDGMSQTDSRLPPEETIINGTRYKTFTMHMSLVRDKSYPLILDMSADKRQYIIFGDESDPEKRYFYKDGKFSWTPK